MCGPKIDEILQLYRPMFLPRRGFYNAVLGVLRVRADGLVTLGPPCCTFIWMSSSGHQRTEQAPYGNEKLDWVNVGSMILAPKVFV
jgi:hypothetical protein